jgi:hypothetical protein
MDLTSAVGFATIALAFGAILGHAFAAGGKNESIKKNTAEIEAHKIEAKARWETTVAEFKEIRKEHMNFELMVTRDYVKNEDLEATESRLITLNSNTLSLLKEMSGKVDQLLGWARKADVDHH